MSKILLNKKPEHNGTMDSDKSRRRNLQIAHTRTRARI